MSLETEVYARLSDDDTLATLVDDRINPNLATINSDLAFVTYSVTSLETSSTLTGPADLERYSVTVDAYALNNSTMLAIMDAVKSALHGWRDDTIKYSKLETYGTTPEEIGFHGQATYGIWYRE